MNLILQTHELDKSLVLDTSVQTLFCKVQQTMMIRVDDELSMLQVRAPFVYGVDDGKTLLLIGRQGLTSSAQGLTEICHWVLFLHEDCSDARVARICFQHKLYPKIRNG